MTGMDVDVDALLGGTVTVLNRLAASEGGTERDEWWPTVVSPALWSQRETAATDGTGATAGARAVTVHLPDSSGTYWERREWVSDRTGATETGAYTLARGDYLVRGDAGLRTPLTRREMLDATEGMDRCEVKGFRDLRADGAQAPATGCLRYASMLYAEGS